VLAPAGAPAESTTWTGAYVTADAEMSTIGAHENVTYGDIQVQQLTSIGQGYAYELLFSGQVAIGATLYTGELSSSTSAWVFPPASRDIPTVDVSGSSGGHQVTGQCRSVEDDPFPETVDGWDFTCQLSLDGGAAAPVAIRSAVFKGGTVCTAEAHAGTSTKAGTSPADQLGQDVARAAARPAVRPENRQPPRNVPSRDR
jgi:hypothetical protein